MCIRVTPKTTSSQDIVPPKPLCYTSFAFFALSSRFLAALHGAQCRFSFPCRHGLHSPQLYLTLPCTHPLHLLQLALRLPCGHGLQIEQRLLSRPFWHGLQSAPSRFTFPCAHRLDSGFCFSFMPISAATVLHAWHSYFSLPF